MTHGHNPLPDPTWRTRVSTRYTQVTTNTVASVLMTFVFTLVIYWAGFFGVADKANWLSWTLIIAAALVALIVWANRSGRYFTVAILAVALVAVLAIKRLSINIDWPDWSVNFGWLAPVAGIIAIIVVLALCAAGLMWWNARLKRNNPPV